jgi:hypothetical protein
MTQLSFWHVLWFEYFQLIPEFSRIPMNDKVILLGNQFGRMIVLYEH